MGGTPRPLYEDGLGQIEFLGNRLHGHVAQVSGIEHHCKRIALETLLGEDVVNRVASSHASPLREGARFPMLPCPKRTRTKLAMLSPRRQGENIHRLTHGQKHAAFQDTASASEWTRGAATASPRKEPLEDRRDERRIIVRCGLGSADCHRLVDLRMRIGGDVRSHPRKHFVCRG